MLLQVKEENDVTNMSIEQFLENIELFLSVIGAFLSLVVAIIICAIKFMKTIKSTQSLNFIFAFRQGGNGTEGVQMLSLFSLVSEVNAIKKNYCF